MFLSRPNQSPPPLLPCCRVARRRCAAVTLKPLGLYPGSPYFAQFNPATFDGTMRFSDARHPFSRHPEPSCLRDSSTLAVWDDLPLPSNINPGTFVALSGETLTPNFGKPATTRLPTIPTSPHR